MAASRAIADASKRWLREAPDDVAEATAARPRFRAGRDLAQRSAEAAKVLAQYPARVPIPLDRAPGGHRLPDVDKRKYLTPRDLTVGQFIYVIRKRLSIESNVALFFSAGEEGRLPASSMTLAALHDECRDADGFLYLEYRGENTFGAS